MKLLVKDRGSGLWEIGDDVHAISKVLGDILMYSSHGQFLSSTTELNPDQSPQYVMHLVLF